MDFIYGQVSQKFIVLGFNMSDKKEVVICKYADAKHTSFQV